MSVNVKTIPTVLDSDKKTGMVVVTNIGANGVYADQAGFKEIQAEQANINNIQSNNINTSTLNAEIVDGAIINGDQGSFDELNAQQANINNENVENSHISSLYADYAGIKQLKVEEADIDFGIITELFSKEITTDYLTVLKSAHFFELVIDKLKAVGGSFILSPADGFVLWGCQYLDSNSQPITDSSQYSNASDVRLFWVCTEDGLSGKYNMWQVGDQALCQNFNNANVGVNANVSSKYCWAMVTNINNREANWVVKLEEESDVVTIVDSTYDSTHPTWRKTDFLPISGVWKNNNSDEVISGADYVTLSDSEKENYTLYNSAYYAVAGGENIIYITEDQYQGVSGHPLNDGYYLRIYNKADCKKCFSINISTSNCDGGSGTTPYYQENGSPKCSTFDFDMGDNFVMLGHQKQDNETTDDAKKRQSAIYLSAYGSIDQDLKAPLIAQYIGISGFDLSSCKWSWFDANGAKFQGQFVLEDGTTIDESVYNYFKLVPNYNIFSRNGAGEVDQHSIDVNILRNIEGEVTYDSIVPNGYTLKAKSYDTNNTIITTETRYQGAPASNIQVPYQNANFHHMVLELSESGTSPKIVDEYVINIQLVSQGTQGPAGPQGSQGPAGDEATNVTLLVAQELCGVRIDNVSTNVLFENMTSSLYTELRYQLVKVEGDTATIIPFDSTGSDRTGYKITLSCSDLKTGSTSQPWYTNSHNQDGTLNTADGWSYDSSTNTLSFTQNNILNVINPSSSYASDNYRNYQYLMTHFNDSDTTYKDRTPLKFKLELKNSSWRVVESRMIYPSYEPQSLFVNNRDMLYSAKISSESYTDTGVQGAKAYAVTQDQTVIQQTTQEIGVQATRLDTRIDGVQGTTSQLVVGVQGIQGSVSQLTNNLNTNYYTKTEVNQTAEQISLQVLGQQGVTQEELRRTGIDIEDGSITLDAEKTVVTGTLQLNDNETGLVIYDSNGNVVVHINNEQINTPGDTTVPQYTYGYSSSTGSWNIASEKVKIGQRKNGDIISITNLKFFISAFDESFIYPSANSGTLTIKIYDSNNTVVYNQNVTMTKISDGSYYYNGTLNHTITTQSIYSVELTTSFSETFANSVKSDASFSYDISYGEQIITRIGANGMFTSQAANQYFLANSNEQTLRMPTSGLRVVNKSDYAGVQVLNEGGWYNIHNSKTTLSLSYDDFSSATVPYGGTNHSVSHAYTINPDDGIYEYIIDTTIGTGDWYMVLPPISSTPVGWRCKITLIKFSTNTSTVKFVPALGQGLGITGANVIIQDAHLDGNGSNYVNQGVTFNTEYEAEFTCLGMLYNVSGKYIGWKASCDMTSL